MKSSKELREALEDIVLQNAGMLDLAETEGRDFTEDEQTRFDENVSKRKQVESEIRKAEEREEAKRMAVHYRKPVDSPETKVKRSFSFLKAVDDIVKGGKLEGLEREIHQEGEREARSNGLKPAGNLILPGFMMTTKEERTVLTAGTAATAGDLVPTLLDSQLIPSLRAELLVERMGATMMTGLTADLTIPRATADASMTWEGEVTEAAATNTSYDLITLSPNRLGGYVDLSRQLLVQNRVPSVEAHVRDSIRYAIKKAVDLEAITGTVTSGGILTASNLGSVALGVDGDFPTYPMLIDLETACAIDNAIFEKSGYITTPGVRGYMKQNVKVTSTDSVMLWDSNGASINGYPAYVTTQVPSTGTKGSGTNLHTMIFSANWAELIVGNFGGIDLLIDPFSQAATATVRMHVFTWWDFAVKHGQAFSACVDIKIS